MKPQSKILLGWREWCALPKLHIPAIKAKIDTGAKTSALHAWELESFHRHGERHVRFIVHPVQRNLALTIRSSAKVIDQRMVMSSDGHKQFRYVILTPIILGTDMWDIEVTLTNRDAMTFRMLLGRDALKGHTLIDPQKTFCQGKLPKSELKLIYNVGSL